MAGFYYQAGNLKRWNSEICTYAQEDIRHGVLWKCRLNRVYFPLTPPLPRHSASSSQHIRGLNCHTRLVFIFLAKAVSSEMALWGAGGSCATRASKLSSLWAHFEQARKHFCDVVPAKTAMCFLTVVQCWQCLQYQYSAYYYRGQKMSKILWNSVING